MAALTLTQAAEIATIIGVPIAAFSLYLYHKDRDKKKQQPDVAPDLPVRPNAKLRTFDPLPVPPKSVELPKDLNLPKPPPPKPQRLISETIVVPIFRKDQSVSALCGLRCSWRWSGDAVIAMTPGCWTCGSPLDVARSPYHDVFEPFTDLTCSRCGERGEISGTPDAFIQELTRIVYRIHVERGLL